MKSKGWDHDAMTAKQRECFKQLKNSGNVNTLAVHSEIARQALRAGGATKAEASRLVSESLKNLQSQGATTPSHIPWS